MDSAEDLCGGEAYIDLKYRFENPPTQRSFPDLVAGILNRLAELHGASGATQPIGWHEFETAADEELATLDEALFEIAHLIAGLASADAAEAEDIVLLVQYDRTAASGPTRGRALDLEANSPCCYLQPDGCR